jgi:hypothetical protein
MAGKCQSFLNNVIAQFISTLSLNNRTGAVRCSTGVTLSLSLLERLELLHQMVPKKGTLAVTMNPSNPRLEIDIEGAAAKLDLLARFLAYLRRRPHSPQPTPAEERQDYPLTCYPSS